MAIGETNDLQRTALARRIFADHGIKYGGGLWQNTEYTKPALAILQSGIFSRGELIAPKGQRYPIVDSQGAPDQNHLLFDLVKTCLDYDLSGSFLNMDILSSFDYYFEWWAEIAQQGGIQKGRLGRLQKEFRDRISKRVVEGKISPHWRHVMQTGEDPPSLARRLAEIIVGYVPKAHNTHIVAWTNGVLKGLGKDPEEGDTSLRLYVGKMKKGRPQGPISITE
jgi:hypothetical protein